jgi:translation elongation factor EF-Tu-like GTPase
MNQKLFTVEDCFKIPGRGIAITGQLEPNSPAFKIGDNIVLIRPDKTEVISEIGDIEKLQPMDLSLKCVGVLLKNIEKKDAPRGTEVFLKT